ncbi:uncharacterized protein LOC141713297 [Apium graveolens]|uniref:uncharacterized protein LOC141713297 n=1 Tax=Apium graveolens TaxID=4045 RepID=UPI003D7A7C75
MDRERAMEEAKSLAQQQQQQQQQQLMLQQHHHHHHHLQQQQQQLELEQQQHHHQQMLLLHQQIQHQQQLQQQSSSLSRLASFRRPQQQLIPSINPNPNLNHPLISNPLQNPNPNLNPSSSSVPKAMRNPAELQMAYQDLRRVCHPDYKTPFSSLQDACERLLPYHVVADYEAEEDDRILDSGTKGQMISRAQQWDNNIAAKIAEFAETFRKQVFAFNIINNKRALGEFRMEERLLIERLHKEDERQSLVELREELESRQNAGREANMVAMVQAEQSRAESQAQAEIGRNIANQEINPEGMINGWAQRDENEPAEDFLDDQETEYGDAGMGEFDLNTR